MPSTDLARFLCTETEETFTIPEQGTKIDLGTVYYNAISIVLCGGSAFTNRPDPDPENLDEIQLIWEAPAAMALLCNADPGDEFTVKVGGPGGVSGASGGWNGGGPGSGGEAVYPFYGRGGGGRTEVRRNGTLIAVSGGRGGFSAFRADYGFPTKPPSNIDGYWIGPCIGVIPSGLPEVDEHPRKPLDEEYGGQPQGQPLPSSGTWTPGGAGGESDGGACLETVETYVPEPSLPGGGIVADQGGGGGGGGWGGGAGGSKVNYYNSGAQVLMTGGRTGGFGYNPDHVIQRLGEDPDDPMSWVSVVGAYSYILQSFFPADFAEGFEGWSGDGFAIFTGEVMPVTAAGIVVGRVAQGIGDWF